MIYCPDQSPFVSMVLKATAETLGAPRDRQNQGADLPKATPQRARTTIGGVTVTGLTLQVPLINAYAGPRKTRSIVMARKSGGKFWNLYLHSTNGRFQSRIAAQAANQLRAIRPHCY